MARKKAKSKVQKLPSITSTDDELQQTTDKTDGSEEGTSVASLKSSSTCQTNDHSDTSRLNHTATISYSSSRPHSLADDISQLSSIDTIDLDLDTDTIVALEDMDEPSGSNGPGPSRVKKHQKLQDKLPAKPKATKTAATVKAAAPAVYTLPPGTILDPNSLSARQPVDPIKEPLRAAALLEVEAGREGQKYLDAAAEWRAELNQKRDKWLEDHADEIYTNKLRHQFLGWVELEADPVSSIIFTTSSILKMCRITSQSC